MAGEPDEKDVVEPDTDVAVVPDETTETRSGKQDTDTHDPKQAAKSEVDAEQKPTTPTGRRLSISVRTLLVTVRIAENRREYPRR